MMDQQKSTHQCHGGKKATLTESITYIYIFLHIRQKPLANLKQRRWLNLEFYFLYLKLFSVLHKLSFFQLLQQPLWYFETLNQ